MVACSPEPKARPASISIATAPAGAARARMRAVHDESSGRDRRQPELGRARPFLRFDPLDGGALDPNAGCADLARDGLGVRRISEQQIDAPAQRIGRGLVLDLEQGDTQRLVLECLRHLWHGGSDGDDAEPPQVRVGHAWSQAGWTKLSMTFLRPECSKAMSSLLPSTCSTFP